MRLTCPNCSARYEVDESMVPASGRDVQCSNCSQTWFQPGRRAAEPAVAEPVAAEPVIEETVAPDPSVEADARLAEVDVDGPSGAPGVEADPEVSRPSRRQIEPAVAEILREEAEREARLRRTEVTPDPVESQAEMPLAEVENTARSRRVAELESAQDAFDMDEVAATVGTAAAASRREQFPDIEEINSTLRATGDRREEEENATDVDTVGSTGRRRGQVRRGFFLTILLAIVAAGVYAYAGPIAEAVPQVSGALEGYVDVVNAARFWLDDMARSLASGTTGSDG